MLCELMNTARAQVRGLIIIRLGKIYRNMNSVKEQYRSPNYVPQMVANRYVKQIRPGLYRVFECAAKKKASNRDKALSKFGSGPTVREYDCGADSLPAWLVERIGKGLSVTWKWC